jgi:hypothetical protein
MTDPPRIGQAGHCLSSASRLAMGTHEAFFSHDLSEFQRLFNVR